jgi:hypothetical protein
VAAGLDLADREACQAAGRELLALLQATVTQVEPEPRHDGRRTIETVCLAEVKSRPIVWLWPSRIALGKLTLLVGDPSLGKSTLALDIAARVSRGASWPDCTETSPPGQVLIASAEDGLEDTVRPRLETAGAELSRVHAIRMEQAFSLCEEDFRALEVKVLQLEGLRLLVIDPVSAFLGGADSNKNADVRAALAPLAALAERHGIAVLAVSHLTKAQAPALYRTLGSVAFVATARAVWFVAKDKQDPSRRLLVQGKNNLGDALALAFRVDPGPGPAGTTLPTIAWEPDPVSIAAEEALAHEAPNVGGSDLEHACEWLREELGAGPIEALTVIGDASENGISKKTLYRAKDRLRVRSTKQSTQGPWFWMLEGSQGGQAPGLATFGDLGHLGPGSPENGAPAAARGAQRSQDGQPRREATLGDGLARPSPGAGPAEPALFDDEGAVERWH